MILNTNNLQYTYQNGKVVSFPDIEIKAGQKVLIIGFSGSGKTTLLNLISGALKIQSGEVNLLGNSYSSMSSTELDRLRADHIGYIFQTLNLIPFLSVAENIALGVKFSNSRSALVSNLTVEIERLLKSLGLDKEVLASPVDNLSIGQQQRVAVARALLGSPNLILADEPTSALDQNSTNNFLNEVMQTFNPKSQAILMVSHDLSLAPHFDTVIDFNKANV
ncbi:ATP-binding cassette domain-containing protein [Candidatus Thioglobus sp.]|nr:ATP-binding cassette domain-containing protein [Candidatus Thioglobus sp.]MDB3892790.1 ATP-binding cassette domain-containing protein [Candidatus Thioglobus sp.]MDC0919865.1 ATP-binding cassette domain-containing protein [Candidatus Thioglobus sp.]